MKNLNIPTKSDLSLIMTNIDPVPHIEEMTLIIKNHHNLINSVLIAEKMVILFQDALKGKPQNIEK